MKEILEVDHPMYQNTCSTSESSNNVLNGIFYRECDHLHKIKIRLSF